MQDWFLNFFHSQHSHTVTQVLVKVSTQRIKPRDQMGRVFHVRSNRMRLGPLMLQLPMHIHQTPQEQHAPSTVSEIATRDDIGVACLNLQRHKRHAASGVRLSLLVHDEHPLG